MQHSTKSLNDYVFSWDFHSINSEIFFDSFFSDFCDLSQIILMQSLSSRLTDKEYDLFYI